MTTAGISRRYIDSQDFLNSPAWNRAAEEGAIVGSCRQPGCSGLLKPTETHQAGTITWYGACCVACGSEVASPNAHTLARSSRRDEMPAGWWDRRSALLDKLKGTPQSGAA